MNTVSITDFRNNIGTYIDKVIYNDEVFFLKKGKSVVAKIVKDDIRNPAKDKKARLMELAGAWKGKEGDKIVKILKAIDTASKKDVKSLKFN